MGKQLDQVRRKDRQKEDLHFLHALLDSSISCSFAVATDDFPLIHSTFFVYDKETDEVIFHFSKHGFGAQEILNGKKVALTVYKYGKLYTAEKAVDFGCEYQSVVIYGHIQLIEDEAGRRDAMQLFFDRFFRHIPSSEYKDFTIQEYQPVHVIRVKIEKWVGKEHLVPEKALRSFYPDVKPVI